MDIDTKQFNRKIKEVRNINTYSESSIATTDKAIEEAYKLIEQLKELKEFQLKKLTDDEVWNSMLRNAKKEEKRQSLKI